MHTFIRALKAAGKSFFWLFLFFMFSTHSVQAEKNKLELLQEHFSDILLVIYFNHPYYKNIEFEKELYSPVFKNIVFYGDRTGEEIAESLHVDEDGDHGDFHIVYTRNGYFYARLIKKVLKDFPGYTGYIFMQDDCIMQFWNFLHLDKGKIWYGVNERKSFSVCHIDQHIENSWYSSTIGIEEVKKILPCLTPKEKEVLDDNFGKDSFGFYWCDFFYLPVRFSERAIQLCDQLSRVWCDLAVSTILGVSDHLKNWEKLPHSWTCFIQDNYLIEYYKPEFYWLHPIKYSSESNRNYVRSVFKEQFYDNLEEVSANE